MLSLQRGHVQVVRPFHPDLAQGLEPCWRKHLDVFSEFGDIAVFCAVNVADNEVRYVRCEVELDGCTQVGADVAEGGLVWGSE
jgi:hypothetical protein